MNRSLSALTVLLLGACATDPVDAVIDIDDGMITDAELLAGQGDLHEGSDRQPIIYGGSAPDAPEHAATVALHQLTRDGTSVYTSPFCSGTLIADDVVLTAAHCLDTAKGGGSFRTMKAGELAIYVGDDPAADILDHLYAVSETVIYPSYDRRRLYDDLALVRLSVPITESVTPVANLPTASALGSADIGINLNFAGFGQTEDGSAGVKLQADTPLAGFGCVVSGCPSGDDPATQISYSQRDGAGPCFGDSGGPAFVLLGGVPYVAGVTSYGDSYCDIYGVSTRVSAYDSYIASFVGSADTGVPGDGGVDSGVPGDGGVDSGVPGDGGSDSCGDGVCGTGESCDGRSGTIACEADCDGLTKGKPDYRYCEVEGVCEGPGCP